MFGVILVFCVVVLIINGILFIFFLVIVIRGVFDMMVLFIIVSVLVKWFFVGNFKRLFIC